MSSTDAYLYYLVQDWEGRYDTNINFRIMVVAVCRVGPMSNSNIQN